MDALRKAKISLIEEVIEAGQDGIVGKALMEDQYVKDQIKDHKRAWAKTALEQRHECKWAVLYVIRKGNKVCVMWRHDHKLSAEDGARFHVTASIREIEFDPLNEVEPENMKVLYDGDANRRRSFRVAVDEGSSYLVEFMMFEKEVGADSLVLMTAVVSVPLTAKSKILLEQAIATDSNTAEKLETFIEKRERIDNKLKDCVDKIRAKGLSPEEESERIEEVTEYANWLRQENE